jgi:hypothetical protein
VSTWWAEPQNEKHQRETNPAQRQENPVEKIHVAPVELEWPAEMPWKDGEGKLKKLRRIGAAQNKDVGLGDGSCGDYDDGNLQARGDQAG